MCSFLHMILPHQERFHLTFQMNFQSFRLTPQLFGSKSYPPLFRNAGGKKRKFWAGREPRNNWQPTHPPLLEASEVQTVENQKTNKQKTDKHLTAQVRLFVVLVVKTKRLQTLSTSRVDTTTRADKEATSKLRKETRTLPSYGDKRRYERGRVEAGGDTTPEEKVKRKVLKLLPKPTLFTLSIKTYHLR